jgi:hypothetical protein
MARPGRIFALVAVAVLACGAVATFLPFLTRERAVTVATPVPDPISPLEKLKLKPGRDICLDAIPFTPDAARVRLLVPALDGPPQPLTVRLRATGLDERHEVPATYAAGTPLTVGFTAVKQASFGSVCVRNAGRRSVNLGMTSDPRNISRSRATIDGKPYGNEVPITLLAPKKASLISRLGAVRDHIAAFKPGLAGALVWPLFLLAAFGVPALIVWGVAAGLRAADDDPTTDG